MNTAYRIVFEAYNPSNQTDQTTNRQVLMEGSIDTPTSILDFSLSHEKQIDLLKSSLDAILSEKARGVNADLSSPCSHCKGKMVKFGQHKSTFSDVFTEHTISFQRARCVDCHQELPSTVRTVFNGTQSGDLVRLQTSLGAKETFRDAEVAFELFSAKKRSINNHNRIKEVSRKVGDAVIKIDKAEKDLIQVDSADELIINVDGGHVKTVESQRSIEALAAVVYQPGSLKSNSKGTRNYLTSKHCAASVKNDSQQEMIANTVIAAMKEGLSPNTNITALCDGAENCWRVVDALKPLAKDVTCILDWFHITMKMQNISLPETEKNKFLRVKWHLWRGRIDLALERLDQLIKISSSEKECNKLKSFKTYVTNNRERIINYRERKKNGLVFTSNLAESTVESLINKRCKQQQHMRWSRDGLNPILQLRAKINTPDWERQWQQAVLMAIQ